MANNQDRTVSRIAADANRVVGEISVGNGPRAVAVGKGAVWVANGVDGTVSRIDPVKGVVTKTIAVGANPSGIRRRRRRRLGGKRGDRDGLAARPSSGAILHTVSVGNGPSAIASGDGALWIANAQDSTVTRVDPGTGSVTEVVRTGRNPRALTVRAGAVWVANADDGTVTKIDVSSRRVAKTIPVVGSPTAVAVAAGSVWTTAVSTPASHRGGALQVEFGDPWACDCFDPETSWNSNAWQLMASVYDGLVGYRRVGGAQGGSLVPDLATTVPSPTDEGKTYTFQLRPGLRFSDGRPVRATDVRASFERIYKVGYSFNQVPFDAGIVGASACADAPAQCDLSDGIETNDGTGTVAIHLTAADPDFLFKLALPFASVVPADSPGRIDDGSHLPGTGPYKLARFGAKELRLVRNPYFRVWARDAQPAGYPAEIHVLFGRNPDQQIDAVTSGAADYVSDLPQERLADLSTHYAGQLHSDPLAQVNYVFLRTTLPPFDDVRVRRALNYAVDRRKLLDLEGGPLAAQETCQFLPPNLPGYRPYCPYTLDPNSAGTWTAPDITRASALVEESGTKGMRVQMFANRPRERVGRYIVKLLKELGYRASLRVIDDFGKYYAYVYGHERPVQLATSGWVADYIAPANFLQVNFACPSHAPLGVNDSEFCDPRIDELMRRAAEAQIEDPAVGLALWAKVDRAVADEAATVFLDNPRSTILVSKRVGNFQPHPEYGPLLDQLWVK